MYTATTVSADGVSSTPIVVQIRDALLNPVQGVTVQVNVTGRDNRLLPRNGTTDAAGLFRASLSSLRAEAKQISVVGSLVAAKIVTFTQDSKCSGIALLPDVPAVASGQSGSNLLAADFNKDGIDDLAMVDTNLNGEPGVVFLGVGDGTLSRAGELPGSFWRDLAKGDFDQDGNIDLALSGGDGQTGIFFGDGAGGFSSPALFPTVSAGTGIAIGDFNADGFPDVAVFDQVLYASTVHLVVLLNDGLGSLLPAVATTLPGYPLSVRVADLDEDGADDLVYSSNSNTSWRRSNGDGTFGVEQSIAGVPTLPLGDFDADMHVDLLGLSTLLRGLGDGTFASPNLTNLPGPAIAQGDIDKNGSLDIIFIDNTGPWTALNQGNGAFASLQALTPSMWVQSAAIGDFDGDGLIDVALGPVTNGIVRLHTHATNPSLVDHFNHPGSVSNMAIADLNGDGWLDLVTSSHFDTNEHRLIFLGPNLSSADPTFDHVESHAPGQDIAFADLNADGNVDAVWTGAYSGAWVELGLGDGNLGPAQPVGDLPRVDSVQIDDIDDDGHLDAVFISRTLGTIIVAFGNGSGQFPLVRSQLVGTGIGDEVQRFAIGDVVTGGTPEIVVTGEQGRVFLLTAKGDGTFNSQLISTGAYPSLSPSPVLFDANEDGKLDIMVASTTGALLALLGDGQGTFTALNSSTGNGAFIRAGDFDRDGHLDLAAWTLGAFHILLGHGDGSFSDPRYYSARVFWELVTGDLNRDGRIDFVGDNPDLIYDHGCR
jgi:hypothetical protein